MSIISYNPLALLLRRQIKVKTKELRKEGLPRDEIISRFLSKPDTVNAVGIFGIGYDDIIKIIDDMIKKEGKKDANVHSST